MRKAKKKQNWIEPFRATCEKHEMNWTLIALSDAKAKHTQIKYSFWIFNWIWDFVLTFSSLLVICHGDSSSSSWSNEAKADRHLCCLSFGEWWDLLQHSNITMMMLSVLVLSSNYMVVAYECRSMERPRRIVGDCRELFTLVVSKILLK